MSDEFVREIKMGGEADDDRHSPLLGSSSSSSDTEANQPLIKRTGNEWTAIAHVITGVIGAGVLSLSWSVAQLGWIAGPLSIILFASFTLVSTNLLSDCYRYPSETGPTRTKSYMDAVRLYLGEKWEKVSVVFVQESLYGCGVAYTITAASSVRALGVNAYCTRKGENKDFP